MDPLLMPSEDDWSDAVVHAANYGITITIRYDTIGEFNVDWKAEY